jgi:hypothetical protein
MGAATKEAWETKIKVFESSKQGKTGPDLLFLQLLETTRTESTAGRKVELNPNTEKLEYPIGSLVLQIDSFQYGYLTNSSLPTTLNMMARLNLSNGSESTLSQLN